MGKLEWSIIGVIAIVVFLTSALLTVTASSKVKYAGSEEVVIYKIGGDMTFGSIYQFTTNDGTRCVATYKGGLDCDFQKAE